MIVGVSATISSVAIFLNSRCETLSFDGQGGGRAIRPICFPDSSGAVPGWLGGSLVLIFGLAVFPWQKFSKLFDNLDSAVNSPRPKIETPKPIRNPADDISEAELLSLPAPMAGSGYPKTKGWNLDPSKKFHERYWDGDRWTFQTRSKDWRKQARDQKLEYKTRSNNQVSPKPTEPATPLVAIPPPLPKTQHLSAELTTLSDLYSKGLLSEEEFKNAKKQILG
jgi:hypothetical protein